MIPMLTTPPVSRIGPSALKPAPRPLTNVSPNASSQCVRVMHAHNHEHSAALPAEHCEIMHFGQTTMPVKETDCNVQKNLLSRGSIVNVTTLTFEAFLAARGFPSAIHTHDPRFSISDYHEDIPMYSNALPWGGFPFKRRQSLLRHRRHNFVRESPIDSNSKNTIRIAT